MNDKRHKEASRSMTRVEIKQRRSMMHKKEERSTIHPSLQAASRSKNYTLKICPV